MLLVADNRIPYLDELFGEHTEIVRLPGHAICAKDLRHADALLVRTITPLNPELLNDTPLRWAGSATAGIDHIDVGWLDQSDIEWSHAPGCNADAVKEYFLCSVAALQSAGVLNRDNITVGIIGVGQCGRRIQNVLENLSYEVLLNDPPRADAEPDFSSTPLHDFVEADLICIHTPLTTSGKYPTHHLLDTTFLNQLKPGTVILNAARGAVLDNAAALQANHITYCLDVWENEPNLSPELLQCCFIATPHIAGYSKMAKWNASKMIYDAACEFFGWTPTNFYPDDLIQHDISFANNNQWQEQVLKLFDPRELTQTMQQAITNANNISDVFRELRGAYKLRDSLNLTK